MIANTEDQASSIKVVVDEIWNSYDLDNSGALDKEETRLFITELVPEMSSYFEFSDERFNKLFNELDINGEGTVEKEEMAGFILEMLRSDNDQSKAEESLMA